MKHSLLVMILGCLVIWTCPVWGQTFAGASIPVTSPALPKPEVVPSHGFAHLYQDINADTDGDGLKDIQDNCPEDYNPQQQDDDGDGWGDMCDNCPHASNPGQEADSDGFGLACLADMDSDGIRDRDDNCVNDPNPDQLDSDHDGRGDVCETVVTPPAILDLSQPQNQIPTTVARGGGGSCQLDAQSNQEPFNALFIAFSGITPLLFLVLTRFRDYAGK